MAGITLRRRAIALPSLRPAGTYGKLVAVVASSEEKRELWFQSDNGVVRCACVDLTTGETEAVWTIKGS